MRHFTFGFAVAVAFGMSAAAQAGGPAATGCSDCNSGCGKLSLFDRWKCGWGCGWGCNSGGLCAWLKRPCPSSAPFLRQQDLPLGFPNHPYVRSPRDYFMDP
jgi:hypothetical protein